MPLSSGAHVTDENCLTEDEVSCLVEGRLEGESLARAERHLADCEACMRLVAEVGDGLSTGEKTSAPASQAPDTEPISSKKRVGRYVILEVIGEGAMGRVYAAHDPALDRRIALKVLHAHASTPELEARLLREAKAMARLSHPEVITVHDAGTHGERLFIAMELVDGGTLREWLARSKHSWREILAVFLRAGRGLSRAHQAGIIHRDFKPDNVMIGKDGRVRVTDFGLACTMLEESEAGLVVAIDEGATVDSALTRTGTLLGTPAYMAPEQLQGKAADARSDVYAFCVALYEALFGERPFSARTFAAMRKQKLSGEVSRPSTRTRVPSRLRRAISIGLRPIPSDRYASMEALLFSLEAAARTPRSPYVLGALGVAALIGLGAWSARGSRGREPTMPAMAAVVACSVSACVDQNGGAPSTCRASDGACVAVASEDCTPVFDPDDLRDEGTVWLGAMFPTKGPNAESFGAMNAEGASFAREEIARATRSLSGSNASLRVRRVALALCDDSVDPMRAARHLVDDVGAPAILGFGSGKEIEDVAGALLIGRRVLTMASLTSSPLVTRLPQPSDLPRMVWRTTFSLDAVADAAAVFVRAPLEALTKGKPGETKVTLARVESSNGLWFAEAFFRRLVFNGKPAVDNGGKFRELVFKPSSSDDDVARFADRVVETPPSVLVLLGPSADTARIIAAVEARGARPIYVIAVDSTAIVAPWMGTDIERRRRVFAIASVTRTAEAQFVMRFNAAHARQVTRTFNPGVTYDAFYVLAYAIFALDRRPVTGPAIAEAIPRLLPPGKPIETGPSDLFEALTTLSRGEHVDLDGPSGSLDFDAASGEVASDFALLCPGLDEKGNARDDVESGVVFHAGGSGSQGELRCP